MKSFKQHQSLLKEEELLLEAEATATAFEGFIAIAYNGGRIKSKKNQDILTSIKKSEDDWIAYKKAATAIANKMKKDSAFKAGGTMTHEGTLNGTLSSKWTGTDTTSKADCSVGAKRRISFKAGESAQFMSSHVEEAVSVFHAALEYMKDSGNAPDISKIVTMVEKALTVQVHKGFRIGDLLNPIQDAKDVYKDDLKDKIKIDLQAALEARDEQKADDKKKKKKNQKYPTKDELKKQITADYESGKRKAKRYSPGKIDPKKFKAKLKGKEFKKVKGKHDVKGYAFATGKKQSDEADEKKLTAKALEKLYFDESVFQDKVTVAFDEFFNKNAEFKTYYVFEAMTGVKKFTKTKPKANWLLVFELNGKVIAFKRIANDDGLPHGASTGYLWKHAKKARFRMSWKNHGMSSTRGTYPSIRGEFLDVKKEHKEHSTMAELISEGFESFVEKEQVLIEEAIKDHMLIQEGILSWGKSKVKKLYNKIKDFLSKMVAKIIGTLNDLAKKGMDAVLFFLGVKLSSVKVTGFK